MKKILSFILAVVCVLCFFTVNVSAQSYSVDDTDVSITVDSKEWKVFTRKNVSGNSELKSMGISPQYFYDAMINTNVYLEMFRVKENSRETIEFKIYKENNTDINNYKNLSERKLRKIGKGLSAKRSADSWKLYSSENPYIYMEYSDIEYNYVEYYTVVNQEVYRLVASKANKFSDVEKESIRGIVDSAEYKINSLYANESGFQKFWAEYAIQTVVVIILIGMVIGAVVLFKKRKTIKKVIKSTKPLKPQPPKSQPPKPRAPRPHVPQPPKPSAPKAPQPRVPQPPKPKKPADATMVTIDRTKRKSRKK